MEVRHIIWQRGRVGGRLAVAWPEADLFRRWPVRLERLSGNCPAALDMFWLLDAVLPEGWHRIPPPHRWRIDLKIRRSGAADFRLRLLTDVELFRVESAATIHVSMHGILNQGVEAPVWALAAIVRTYQDWFRGEPDFDKIIVVGPKWSHDDFGIFLPRFPEERQGEEEEEEDEPADDEAVA